MVHSSAKARRRHARHSATLMQQAKEELERGDRRQAAKKSWGAFVYAVKVVANRRRWEYLDHSQLNALIRALVHESGERRLINESQIAQSLHRNYYNDEHELEEIAVMQQEVESALARLREISRRYRTDRAYRRRADALRPPNSRYDLRRHRWERITPTAAATTATPLQPTAGPNPPTNPVRAIPSCREETLWFTAPPGPGAPTPSTA